MINKLEENFNNICKEIKTEFKNDVLTKINEYELQILNKFTQKIGQIQKIEDKFQILEYKCLNGQ